MVLLLVGICFFVSGNLFFSSMLNRGLRRYYCLEPAEILCIGHSMTEMGIDKDLLQHETGMHVAKFCMNGAGIKDRFVMLKQYIESTHSKPRWVFYDVGPRSFSSGLSHNSYALFYPFMDESKEIDAYIRQYAEPWSYWSKKLIPLCRYDDTRLGAVVRGYRGDWSTFQTRKFDHVAFREKIKDGNFWKISFDKDLIAEFDRTLRFLKEQKINVLLLALPNAKILNDAEPEKYRVAMDIIKEKSQKYPNVTLFDLNPDFADRYEFFFDPIHLNRDGQVILSREISARFNALKQ